MSEGSASFWTGERVEFLREWRGKGASVADIAAALSTTPGAIAGKCARLKIPCERRDASVPVFVPRPTLADIIPLADTSDVEVDAWEATLCSSIVRLAPTSLLDRKFDQCAAVLDARGPDGLRLMCGKPSISGPWGLTSWCQEHHDLFHRKDDHG